MVATFPPVKSHSVVDLLRDRYAPPAWAFLEQVANGTGFAADRHVDAIAMGVWPSRGLELLGFEVKVSRNDWRRELRKPDKAEPIAERMDRFYVVAPADVVPRDEVPAAWGLLEVVGGKKLIERKPAEKLDPEPLDRLFLAAILRKAASVSPTLEMRAEARRQANEEVERSIESRVESRTYGLQTQLDALRERVTAFEARTGIPLEKHERDGWYGFPSGEELADAVLFLARGGTDRVRQQLRSLDHTITGLQKLRLEAAELFAPDEVAPSGVGGTDG